MPLERHWIVFACGVLSTGMVQAWRPDTSIAAAVLLGFMATLIAIPLEGVVKGLIDRVFDVVGDDSTTLNVAVGISCFGVGYAVMVSATGWLT
jgi:hypothetical protein